jgi:hypothetical protein
MTTLRPLPIPWPELQRAFRADGWLRDIYIGETELTDWQRAYDYVRNLVADGFAAARTDPEHLPDNVPAVFALQNTVGARMSLDVGTIGINCHFFTESMIEFDINPAGIESPTEAQTLLQFMEGLSRAVGRDVMLTGDSQPYQLWLTYIQATSTWVKGHMFERYDDELDGIVA